MTLPSNRRAIPVPLIDPDEAGRRVSAARAYARLTRAQLAARIPLTAKQIKDLEAGRRSAATTTREELRAIARACQVPADFLTFGFQGGRELEERLERIVQAFLSGAEGTLDQLARDWGVRRNDPGSQLADGPTAPSDASDPRMREDSAQAQ